MKKTILKYITVLLLAMPVSSCSDYLDTLPIDKASPDTFLKDIEQAKSLLAGIYNCFYDDSPSYITPYTYALPISKICVIILIIRIHGNFRQNLRKGLRQLPVGLRSING